MWNIWHQCTYRGSWDPLLASPLTAPHQYFPLHLNSVNRRCISSVYCCLRSWLKNIIFSSIFPLHCCVVTSMICQCAVLYCGNLFWRLAAQSGRANTFDSFIFQQIYCSHNPGKYLQIWWIYFPWQPLLEKKEHIFLVLLFHVKPFHLIFKLRIKIFQCTRVVLSILQTNFKDTFQRIEYIQYWIFDMKSSFFALISFNITF